jgi:UDP-N-acetylglucosamine 2-epimerase (non-hydrolysing)
MKDEHLTLLIAGARPNFMKIAPVARAFRKSNINYKIVHTGQHYDYNLSKVFFEDLSIPSPDFFLEVGSASHAVQTASVMVEFEKLCLEHNPNLVLVFGDVNSTIACALVASKLGIRVGHVEAGLRSLDREMPEEINRILTDHISDILFTTSELAVENLINEGISQEKIHFVGNVMIDTLVWQNNKISNSEITNKLHLNPGSYDVLTLHRPSNVDNKETLNNILQSFNCDLFKKVIFPIHPRTMNSIKKFNLENLLENKNLVAIDPLGYNDFISLVSNSNMVWTDSGGIQEETSFLGVRCMTLRKNTERPETISLGTNILINPTKESIIASKKNTQIPVKKSIPLWDGKAGTRISNIIMALLE